MKTRALKKVKVKLGARSYDICVGDGLLEGAARYLKPHLAEVGAVIVTDGNVTKAGHLQTLERSLKTAGISSHAIVLKPGESTKSFSPLQKLLNRLLALKPERRTALIALGGGVIGDLTGFAASVLLRGVPFIQIPTTLLAMVDSSVGGKTGINTKYGENLVGNFYQPSLVLADVSVLETLPKREILAGYAEIVKYGLINNKKFFEKLEKSKRLNHMENIITSCKAKAAIVAEDERESGARALLNLGHTFAHALEAETGFSSRLLHGEAVAIGMVMAFQFSHYLGYCDKQSVTRVTKHLQRVGLKTSPREIRGLWLKPERVLAHMRQDKKVEAGKLTFILARGIGEAFVAKGVNEDQVIAFLERVS